MSKFDRVLAASGIPLMLLSSLVFSGYWYHKGFVSLLSFEPISWNTAGEFALGFVGGVQLAFTFLLMMTPYSKHRDIWWGIAFCMGLIVGIFLVRYLQ